MSNTFFSFKQFTVHQDNTAMKVCTDSCLFGAWAANYLHSNEQQWQNILDIGAGTGLLSLMLAQKTNASINAIEIDENSAAQAKENFDHSPWRDRLHLIHLPVQEYKPAIEYDCIISNPPFFNNSLLSPNPSVNLTRHEASLDIDFLLKFFKNTLTGEGTAFLLVPFDRSQKIDELIAGSGLNIGQKVAVHQSSRHGAFRMMYMLCKKETKTQSSVLVIRNESGNYSDEFSSLLKDYYLAL